MIPLLDCLVQWRRLCVCVGGGGSHTPQNLKKNRKFGNKIVIRAKFRIVKYAKIPFGY